MLKNLAWQAAGRMGNRLQASNDDLEIYAYSLEIILNMFFQTFIYLGVSILLGVFCSAFMVMASFSSFRFFGGGYHLKTFPRCLTFSGLMIAGFVGASLLYWPDWIRWTAAAIVSLGALLVIHKWVPAGTEKKTITDPYLRRRQKQKILFAFLLWLAFLIIFEFSNYVASTQSIIMGLAGSLFCITPWGYTFWSSVDHILDLWGKEA